MVKPAEARGHVIGSLILSLQSQQAYRQSYARGLRLELHGKRQIQEILLGRHKKECAVFLDVPAQGSAKLVLHVDSRIAESISRREVRIAVHIEAFTMPVVGS